MAGCATALVMRLQFESGSPVVGDLADSGSAPQAEARLLQVEDLVKGLSFSGQYGPAQRTYLELLSFLGVNRAAWGDALPLTLLATSYFTGMELPGESAAFRGLRADFSSVQPRTPSDFEVSLDSYDERFRLVETRFSLASGQAGPYARGEITAVARAPRLQTQLASLPTGSGRFAGKTAVVIGASRGLARRLLCSW